MVDQQAAKAPEDFDKLGELHDVAAHAVELLKAMANEWRLMILCQLSEGEKTVSELQEILGLSQSALSQQLARLRREGLVTTRRESQVIHYSLADGPADKIIHTLHEIFCASRNLPAEGKK